MSLKYCALCKRGVEPKRVIGVGTFILALLTFGFWLLTIPFYRKKCPICKSTLLTDISSGSTDKKSDKEETNSDKEGIQFAIKTDFEKKKMAIIIIASIVGFMVLINILAHIFNKS